MMDYFFASEGLLATLAIIAIFGYLSRPGGSEAGLLHFLEVDVGDVVVGGGGVGVG